MPGRRIAAPIFKQWAETAFKDLPKVPFVAPRHPHGPHRPREAGAASLAPSRSRKTRSRRSSGKPSSPRPSRAAPIPQERQNCPRPAAEAKERRLRRVVGAASARLAWPSRTPSRQPAAISCKPERHLLGLEPPAFEGTGTCAPKRRLISTRSRPPRACCADSLTGTARTSGWRSSTRWSRIRRCGTTPRRAGGMRERRGWKGDRRDAQRSRPS